VQSTVVLGCHSGCPFDVFERDRLTSHAGDLLGLRLARLVPSRLPGRVLAGEASPPDQRQHDKHDHDDKENGPQHFDSFDSGYDFEVMPGARCLETNPRVVSLVDGPMTPLSRSRVRRP
jgi:hypothetical protein